MTGKISLSRSSICVTRWGHDSSLKEVAGPLTFFSSSSSLFDIITGNSRRRI